MNSAHYTMSIDSAFEEVIGAQGACRARYRYWLETLAKQQRDIMHQPQREAEPMFTLPKRTDDLAEIDNVATRIRGSFGALVVAGMGGSSLSGDALARLRKSGGPAMHFLDNIDPHSMSLLLEELDWTNTAFLIISKSGNTIETTAQLAVLLRHAQKRGLDIARHFFVITIPNDNQLHMLATQFRMTVIAHDEALGGRFSILSSVGLIPAAVMGLDIRALRAGAASVISLCYSNDPEQCAPAQSAALHRALMEKNVRINVMMHYCDRLGGLADWYRQCWAESLGKCAMASTPVRSRGATDQHSQLQLYLEGPNDKLFSLLMPSHQGTGDAIDFGDGADARFDFLKGKTLGDLIDAEQKATLASLTKHGRPARTFIMNEVNEDIFGALIMHCAMEVVFTAALLGVNAFNQPAVEDGKVFALQYLAETRRKGAA